jgi:hypothetical protein
MLAALVRAGINLLGFGKDMTIAMLKGSIK